MVSVKREKDTILPEERGIIKRQKLKMDRISAG